MRELAAVYLGEMRRDSGPGQARLFLVPDDHLDAIKQLIDERHADATQSGNAKEAEWLAKQRGRASPLGVTYDSLSAEADVASRVARGRIVARYAGPVITLVFLAYRAGSDTYQWSTGEITGREFVLQLAKAGSEVSIGSASAYLASRSDWLAGGPNHAGGVVTSAVFLAEEGWLIYEYGGFGNAFAAPGFYVKTGGNLGAAGLGLIAAVEMGKLGAAIGAPLGPCGPAIGGVLGMIAGGAIGGTVGYLGSASLTDWMLQTLTPSFYYGMKILEVEHSENRLHRELNRLTDLARPLAIARGAR
jgi:hypothetical protein